MAEKDKNYPKWIDDIKWSNGLVPAISQDHKTGKVMMMAWMNKESLLLSLQEKQAIYWSRSRQKLWRKGESSGHVQILHDVRTDCDYDTLLLQIEQRGGIACHTGRESCFYKQWQEDQWVDVEPVLKNPDEIYK